MDGEINTAAVRIRLMAHIYKNRQTHPLRKSLKVLTSIETHTVMSCKDLCVCVCLEDSPWLCVFILQSEESVCHMLKVRGHIHVSVQI